jgi:hypothetical protein
MNSKNMVLNRQDAKKIHIAAQGATKPLHPFGGANVH